MEAVVKNQGIVKIILKKKFPEYRQKICENSIIEFLISKKISVLKRCELKF